MSLPGWLNQHAYTVVPLSPTKVFFGIFDGYGIHGNHIAKAVRTCFNEVATVLPGPECPSLSAYFAQAFEYADKESALTGFLVGDSGTFVTVGVVDLSTELAAIAHVGSSLVIVANRHGITYQSKSHMAETGPKLPIASASTADRQGASDMSRSDWTDRRALSNPMITTDIKFTPGSVLTVASDGVWQKVGAQDVASTSTSTDAQTAAHEMVLKARACWCSDQWNGTQEFSAVVVQSTSAAEAAVPGFARRRTSSVSQQRGSVSHV